MWSDAIQMFFLLLVTSVLTYLIFCWRKASGMAKEIDELNARIKDLLAQNAVLNDRNAKFEANILQLKTDLTHANDQIGNLNAQLRGAKEQSADRLLRIQTLEGFEAQFIDMGNRYGNLETQYANLNLQLQQSNTDKTNLTQQLAEQNAAFLALQERYNALLNSSNQLRSQVDELQLLITAANSQNQQADNLTLQIAQIEAGNAALLRTIEQQQEDIDNLKQETDTLNNLIDQKDNLITDLQTQIANLNTNPAKQTTTQNDTANDDDDPNALMEALSLQVGNLEIARQNLALNFSNAQTQLAEKDDFITLLQGKLASLSVHLADKETDNNRLALALADCQKKYTATAQELSEEEKKLEAIRAKMSLINFERIGYATAADKDNLQLIKGIGPFIEQKLNALGIYTFRQIANFTPDDVERVTDAIEFFPGRIERDNWVSQALQFVQNKG